MFYKSFECVHGDTDRDGNAYMNIDGYPEGEDAVGGVIGTVYLTPHGDFVVHIHFEEYRNVPEVIELIEAAKEDLRENRHSTITKRIKDMIQNEDAVFNACEDTVDIDHFSLGNNQIGYLRMIVEASDDVVAYLAGKILPDYHINSILKEYDVDSISDAIEYGANFEIVLNYFKDYYTDELTLELADKTNDIRKCDGISIDVRDINNCEVFEIFPNPDERFWFIDFINSELKRFGKPSARSMITAFENKNKSERSVEI